MESRENMNKADRQPTVLPALHVPEPDSGHSSIPIAHYQVQEQFRTSAPGQDQEGGQAQLIAHYLWILKRQRWKILLFVAASVMATLIVSERLQPVYEARTTIDVDRQVPTGVIGQDSNRTATNDAEQFLSTQVRLIQSDSVLRPVAQKYNLLELENGGKDSDSANALRDERAPVSLKQLKVDSPRRTYLIMISYRAADPELAANVSNAIAQSFLEHTFNIRYKSSAELSTFMEKQMEELKAKVEKSSAALAQFETGTERHQPGRKDQHHFRAPAAAQQRIYAGPGGPRQEGSGL